MLCSYCRHQMLESGKSWGYHHHDLGRFEKSLEETCTVCAWLKQDLNELADWLADDGVPEDAVYRWTLRKAAAIRETSSIVTLTIRPIIDGGKDTLNQAKRATLSTRTFFFIPEEDLGHVPAASDLSSSTDSAATYAQIAHWMRECADNHPQCAKRSSIRRFLPTRLIDVGIPEGPWPPESFKIVETGFDGTTSSIQGPYTTLSHCWGLTSPDPEFVEMHDDNYERFTTEGVSWAEMCSNKNFIEAIEVTRKLNVRYIWIDSLCIIQRQPTREDWEKQKDLMHKVYRNSYCNIAAADSSNKYGGLFRPREREDLPTIVPGYYEPLQETTLFPRTKHRVVPGHFYEDLLTSQVLYTRGWVFQERLLSPRLLHFARQQVFWDCSTLTAAEALPQGLPPVVDTQASTDRKWRARLQEAILFIEPIGHASLEEFWRVAVRSYTSCNLGNEYDKINAIWGVAKLVRDILGEDFGAGLWTFQIAEQLCWKVAKQRGKENLGLRPQPLQKLLPSWSWASVKGEIELNSRRPNVKRWWTAQDWDGEPLRFHLTAPVFPQSGKGHEGLRDQIVAMDKEVAAMKARGAGLDLAMMLAADQNSTRAGQAEKIDHQKSALLDVQPELSKRYIDIRCHVMKGILKKVGPGDWAVFLADDESQDLGEVSMSAYPDVRPEREESPCEFSILYLGRQIGHLRAVDDSDLSEEDLEDAHYSGEGLLLQRLDGDIFNRIGAVVCKELSHQKLERWYRSCCPGKWQAEPGDEHPVDQGQRVRLE